MDKWDNPEVNSAAMPVEEEKRLANDGILYTESQFAEHYQHEYLAYWQAALPTQPQREQPADSAANPADSVAKPADRVAKLDSVPSSDQGNRR